MLSTLNFKITYYFVTTVRRNAGGKTRAAANTKEDCDFTKQSAVRADSRLPGSVFLGPNSCDPY